MTSPAEDSAFDALLEYLNRTRGFDFSAYKRPGLMRRVQRRLEGLRLNNFGGYLDYLEVHPEEFARLFDAILINVTSFFRDPGAWEYVQNHVLPRILKAKVPDGPIRLWSAGCASGEEAYTAAILLAEALGPEAFLERAKIYATDVDENALNKARLAGYTTDEVAGVPKQLVEKYFELVSDRFVFRKELRRAVIFGRHDLVQDAPISKVDLLICRNTLMYFNAEVQDRILARFNFALTECGFLFLGKAEMLLTHTSYFVPVDLRHRIFARRPRSYLGGRIGRLMTFGREELAGNHGRRRDNALDLDPLPHLLIDAAGTLIFANEKARTWFTINLKDVGRPFQDLEVSYRPVELRTYLEQAYKERRHITVKDVSWPTPTNEPRFLEILVVPIPNGDGGFLGAAITFTDITHFRRMQDELQTIHQELETAYEELQTSNEELQSTNEELETTNEELETMNEELQSTNEELRTMNDELNQRSEELNHINAFMQSVLANLHSAVIVLNRDLYIQSWNRRAEDVWGLRADEVEGKHLLNLDIGFPVEQLRPLVRGCLAGEDSREELRIPATNRRGKPVECRVTCTPLLNPEKEIKGAILLMEVEETNNRPAAAEPGAKVGPSAKIISRSSWRKLVRCPTLRKLPPCFPQHQGSTPMKREDLAYQIEAMRRRVCTLTPGLTSLSAPSPHLDSAVHELQNALEELQVADEEIRQQFQELTASRQTLEAQRQRYQDLFEFAPNAYVVTDRHGTI